MIHYTTAGFLRYCAACILALLVLSCGGAGGSTMQVDRNLPGGIAEGDEDYEFKLRAYRSMQTESNLFLEQIVSEVNETNADYDLSSWPKIVVLNTPFLMFVDYAEEIVVGPYWEGQDENYTGLFNTWAQEADLDYTGEEFFKQTFNWFLVAHELGHYTDALSGTISSRDFYTAELVANKIAVVHFINTGREAELVEYLEQSDKIAEHLRFPIPNGEDEISYFNNNYEELGSQPQLYGYYQFSQFRVAYNEVKRENLIRFLSVVRN